MGEIAELSRRLACEPLSVNTSMGRPLAGLIAYCRRPWRGGRGLTRTDGVRVRK